MGGPGHYLQLATQVGQYRPPFDMYKISWSSAIRSLGSAASGNNGWLRYCSSSRLSWLSNCFFCVLDVTQRLVSLICLIPFDYQRRARRTTEPPQSRRASSGTSSTIKRYLALLRRKVFKVIHFCMDAPRCSCQEVNLQSEASNELQRTMDKKLR